MMTQSPLQDAIARGLQPGSDLAAAIHELGDYPLRTAEDAEAVCEALERLPAEPDPDDQTTRSPLHAVLGILQGIETREAYEVIAERGIPRLAAVVSEH